MLVLLELDLIMWTNPSPMPDLDFVAKVGSSVLRILEQVISSDLDLNGGGGRRVQQHPNPGHFALPKSSGNIPHTPTKHLHHHRRNHEQLWRHRGRRPQDNTGARMGLRSRLGPNPSAGAATDEPKTGGPQPGRSQLFRRVGASGRKDPERARSPRSRHQQGREYSHSSKVWE